jgi:hypothetical protein
VVIDAVSGFLAGMPLLRLAVALALTPASCPTGAFPSFPNQIPNGFVNRCANCHVDPAGGGERNSFGQAYSDEGFLWSESLASDDSDGDGFTNGAELQDPAGAWVFGDPEPGQQRLVSSPGFDFSTPGERGLALSEVLLDPTTPEGTHQTIEIQNTLPFEVDAADLWLVAAGGAFQVPSGETVVTAIPADATLLVVLNSDEADTPGIVHESVASPEGIGTLGPAGSIALHWIADSGMNFDQAHTMIDYVQWGAAGQAGEDLAEAAEQWQKGTFVPTLASGEAMAFDGYGDTAGDWRIMPAPTPGPNPSYRAEPIVQLLLGLRTLAQVVSPDANGDSVVDIADAVRRLVP